MQLLRAPVSLGPAARAAPARAGAAEADALGYRHVGSGCWRPTCGPGASTQARLARRRRPRPAPAWRRRGAWRTALPPARGALTAAAGASSVGAIEIDDVYDAETLARIEAAGPAEPGERPRPARRCASGAPPGCWRPP